MIRRTRGGLLAAAAVAAMVIGTATGCPVNIRASDEPRDKAQEPVARPGDTTSADDSKVADAKEPNDAVDSGGRSGSDVNVSGKSVEIDDSKGSYRLEVKSLKRGQQNLVTLRLKVTVSRGQPEVYKTLGAVQVDAPFLLDLKGQMKYMVVKDSAFDCICSKTPHPSQGESVEVFTTISAVPASVRTISVGFPGEPPIDDVPLP